MKVFHVCLCVLPGLWSLVPDCRAEMVVVDDYAIERGFEAKMGEIAGAKRSIYGKPGMEKALKAAKGKKAVLPVLSADNRSKSPAQDGVVVVGTVAKCADCGKWEKSAMASGWVLSEDGLVVTNYHVIAPETMEKSYLGVMDRQGNAFGVKEVVAYDIAADVAILRVDTAGKRMRALALAPEPPSPGAPVHVISHPDGRYYCLSKGNVTRYHRQPVDEENVERAMKGEAVPMATWMSVSADFGIGSSGGTVLDENERVVGMVSLTSTVVATTGDEKDDEPLPADGVQMVFKDCVPLPALRALVEER